MKHYDNGNGYEFCSGREGWSSRKTTELSQVTCKNCLKAIKRDIARDAAEREIEARYGGPVNSMEPAR